MTPALFDRREDRARSDRRAELRLESGLRPLSELSDFEVADGFQDVRGWMVTSANGSIVGTVRDLIVDPAAMLARYMDVELGPAGTDEGTGTHVLITVGATRLDAGTDQVLVPAVTAAQFNELPEYRRDLLNRDYDWGLLRRIGVNAVTSKASAETEER